ncbi:MAG TPA: sigma-70 family RNA polymerase sigma factor [Rudaea sp.]
MTDPAVSDPPVIDFTRLAEQRVYLLRIARLQLQDDALAEDCVSDVLTQAYEKRDGFRGKASLRTWLVAILRNRIVDLLRKQWREQPYDPAPAEADFDPLFDDSGHWAVKPTDVNDPAALADQGAFLEAVRQCVEKLPRRVGQVFVLREVFGSETHEICKELSLSTSNVWVQLYRARIMLRTCLENGGFAPAGARA